MKNSPSIIRRLLLHVRGLWLILGMTALFLLVLEGTLLLIYLARDYIAGRSIASTSDSRVYADAYSGVSWVNDYYREFAEVSANRWIPYVYWRRQPYHGHYIDIDANGLRRTWADDWASKRASKPLTVFMFGGSTMWGVGARDDFTIPSLLAKRLNERRIACRVLNFGEAGYVSTQEVVALMRQLHQGNMPDLVIFYDGVNDVYSAYQQQAAGLPQNEFNRQREFNLSQPGQYQVLRKVFLRRTVDRLSMVRFARNVARRLGVVAPAGDAVIRPEDVNGLLVGDEALLRGVAAVYANNVQVVKALADSYGFKAIFYWQPTVFDKEQLTAYEEAERQKVEALQPFYRRVHGLLQQGDCPARSGGAFRDLSGVFSGLSQPLFVDWCHISEWGNDAVAQEMVEDAAWQLDFDAPATSRIFQLNGR